MQNTEKLTDTEANEMHRFRMRLTKSGFHVVEAQQLALQVFCCVPAYDGGYLRDYGKVNAMPRERGK